MSFCIGLAVASDSVRAVAVRRGKVVWAAEAPIESGGTAAAIASVLAEAPLRRWPRPPVHVAIGPHAAQVKRVDGLPQVAEQQLLSSVIRGAPGTFFLKNGIPLITTGVRVLQPGAVWAAALDRPLVDEVIQVCRAHGWRTRLVAPTAIVLPRAVADEAFTWSDGAVWLDITRRGDELETLRGRPAFAAGPSWTAPRPVPELEGLGARAGRFADAYGAAVCSPDQPMVLDARSDELQTIAERRRAWFAPATLLAVAVLSLAFSPIAGQWSLSRARAAIPDVRPEQWRAIRSTISRLDSVDRILDDVNRFAAGRSSAELALSRVARALPDGSVITEIELQGDSIRMSLLSSNAAAVMAAMRAIDQTASIETSGPGPNDPTLAGDLLRLRVRLRLDRGVTPVTRSTR